MIDEATASGLAQSKEATAAPQTSSNRMMIASLDKEFRCIHQTSQKLLESLSRDVRRAKLLYATARETVDGMLPVYSCGEHLLRSAGRIEQTFGGITVNLWDDPFEWTLPEALPSPEDVANYLNEAEAMRVRGFDLFQSDADLSKDIALPNGKMQPLLELLLETLRHAAHHQGRAFATLHTLDDIKLPHL